MRKATIAIAFVFLFASMYSQSCLPEGISFETQSQIDSFSINYPTCTQIEGDVRIDGDSITNLYGLSQITDIFGNLDVEGNGILENFLGLSNLDSIGGGFYITFNYQLKNFVGLESLRVINEDLMVGFHWTVGNPQLESLTGLEGLQEIGEDLYISLNPLLVDLNGLINLDSLGGNIDIRYNSSLSLCSINGICNYLSSPKGFVDIYGNAPGCANPPEIASNCGFTMDCLPYGNYHFTRQAEIDSFAVHYPACSDLSGAIWIEGDMTNLHGLNMVKRVGSLLIRANTALINLEGLDSLTTVTSTIYIGMFPPYGGNLVLSSLSGLNNLDTIGEELIISSNPLLTDISALDSLDGTTFYFLVIGENYSLSHCEAQSICKFLNISGEVDIFNNAQGCNDYYEIIYACATVDAQEIEKNYELTLYPNPAGKTLSISTVGINIDETTIYTLAGQQVLQVRPANGTIDISDLQSGIYIVEVTVEGRKVRRKLLVE